MKTKLLFLCSVLLCWSASSLLAQADSANNANEGEAIRTKDYCDFLNQVAVASQLPVEAAIQSSDLYNEKMQCGYIMRTGSPGNYSYNLMSSASTAMENLSFNDAACYCEWRHHPASASTYYLNCCGSTTASIDPCLKSNILTFRLVNTNTNVYQAGGEGEVCGIMDQILEIVIGIGATTLPGAMRGDQRTSSNGDDPARAAFLESAEHREHLISRLQPFPALDLTITEDAEQRAMSKFFTQILNKKAPDYYQMSDGSLSESERAWEARAAARQHLQAKEEALERAQTKFHEEEELLTNKKIEKTALGRIANATGKASSIAGAVSNVPIVSPSGILQGLSTIADIANRRIEKHSYKKARDLLETATKEEAEARCHFDQLEEAAFAIDLRRKAPEQKAHDTQEQEVLEIARKLKPPLHSNCENDWQKWAEELSQGVTTNRQKILAFAQKTKDNPSWAAQKVAQAWMEKIKHSEANLKDIQEQQDNELHSLEIPYLRAQKKADEARATATAACEREEKMIQEESDTHEEYDALRALLRQLETQKITTALSQATEQAKNETQAAYDAWQKAKKKFEEKQKENQELIEQTEEAALFAETEALKLFQQKEALEKKYARKVTRAQAVLEADQKAWKETWPEELLAQKIKQQSGEHIFKKAAVTKLPSAWLAAENEARELEELWKQMNIPEQEQFWKASASVAAIKRTFLEIQELWNYFSEAVETLIENPDFNSDFKNSQEVEKKAEVAASAVEGVCIDPTILPAAEVGAGLMVRSIRNVANIAKATTNSAKKLPPNFLNDLTKIADETTTKAATKAAEITKPLWRDEASWMAGVVQRAADFAKRMLGVQQTLPRERIEGELQELSKMITRTKKAYRDQLRFMRARWNLAERVLEPQKKALQERKKSFYKRERKWNGEQNLLQLRKKMILQKKNKITRNKKPHQLRPLESTPTAAAIAEEAVESMSTEIEEPTIEQAPIDPEIEREEAHLAAERRDLDEEKSSIDQKEEELKNREIQLTEDGKAMDRQSEGLKLQEQALNRGWADLAQERAALVNAQKQSEEERHTLEKTLDEKAAALKAEELRIAEEREALVKKAESLQAAAALELDAQAWDHFVEKLNDAMEREKNAVLEAEQTEEPILAEQAWQEACDAALALQQLWEEMIHDLEQKETAATKPSEKMRLALELKNAWSEKESWSTKAEALQKKVEASKEKAEQFAQEDKFYRWLKAARKRRGIDYATTKLNEALELGTIAKGIFVHAAETKTKEAWSKAAQEGEVLEAVWNKVIEAHEKILSEHADEISEEERICVMEAIETATTQQAACIEKIHFAKTKIVFAKAKIDWNKFSTAAMTFVQHSDKENLTTVRTAAKAAKTTARKANRFVTEANKAIDDVTLGAISIIYTAATAVYKTVAATNPADAVNIAAKTADLTADIAEVTGVADSAWQEEIEWAKAVIHEAVAFTKAMAAFYQQRGIPIIKVITASEQGEAIFARAEETKTEEAWSEAVQTGEALEATRIEKIHFSKVKAAFAQAKTVWHEFSTAATTFIERPSEENLERARAAATAVATEYNTVAAAANAAANTTAFAAAARIFRATTAAATVPIAAAVANVRAASAAAGFAADSAWQEEDQCATTVDQEVADFTKAVVAFRRQLGLDMFKKAKDVATSKLRNVIIASKQGEDIFARAEETKTEEAWSKAAHEGEALEAAWNEVIEAHEKILSEHADEISKEKRALGMAEIQNATTQKRNWAERISFVKTKAAFARAKTVWNNFSSAATTFIEHPNEENLESARAAANIATATAPRMEAPATDNAACVYNSAVSAIRHVKSATGFSAVMAANHAAVAASLSAGSAWREEVQEATAVAAKAANFLRAVNVFRER